MRSVLDRAIAYVSPATALRRSAARHALRHLERSYDAVRPLRATNGWPAEQTSANTETYGALAFLRARARDLQRNHPTARSVLGKLTYGLVGTGIVVHFRTGNVELDRRIQDLWSRWCEECDADGIQDFYGLQVLAARAFFESGELITRFRLRRDTDDHSVPLQLQVLEGDFIDHGLNRELPDGAIKMGIELDPLGRRRAYWLFGDHPGEAPIAPRKLPSRPVPADSVVHLFDQLRPGQIRGVPWLAPAMLKMRQLDDYEYAELERKKLEAALAAIVMGASDEDGQSTAAPLVTDANNNTVEQFKSGMIAYANGGKSIEFTKPAPVAGYGEYKRAQLHSIAAGAQMTYELVSGDLSQANYSSLRAGLVQVNRMLEVYQWTTFIPRQLRPIARTWLDVAIVSGALPAIAAKCRLEFTPPRFEYVDPLKDALGEKALIRAGLLTQRRAIQRQGWDPDEQLGEIAETNAVLDELGITLDTDPRRVASTGASQTSDPLSIGSDTPAGGEK